VAVNGVAREDRVGRPEVVPDQLASWFLRAGLAFVFSYAAVSSFLHPVTFARYFPAFLPTSWATDLLPVFAVYEMLLVVGFMTRRYTYAAAVLSALTLSGIIVMNPDAFGVLFRNVAIACGALALAVQARQWGPEPAAEQPPPEPCDTLAVQGVGDTGS
jgi:uncharacterized membrane protein